MKTGDLEPSWRVSISDGDQSTDLSDVASWRFVAVRANGTTVFTDENPTVTVGANSWEATVAHDWVSGETDTAGTLRGEIVATWSGGREQTFPSAGSVAIRIESSFD